MEQIIALGIFEAMTKGKKFAAGVGAGGVAVLAAPEVGAAYYNRKASKHYDKWGKLGDEKKEALKGVKDTGERSSIRRKFTDARLGELEKGHRLDAKANKWEDASPMRQLYKTVYRATRKRANVPD